MRWIWIDKFMEFRSGQFARAIKNLTLAQAPQNPVTDEWLGYPSRPIQQGDKNMTNTAAANGKEAAYHGVPAEDDYGYAGDQGRKHDPCVRPAQPGRQGGHDRARGAR